MICPFKKNVFCISFLLDLLHDRRVAKLVQNKQTRKYTNNSHLNSSVRGHLPVPGLTQRTPLKEQLKSNDHRLQDDSSADRLFLMKLDIGLPLTEKSTDSRRPVVEDMEVSFSKYSRLSNGGFQHSEDTYNLLFLCKASFQLQGVQHMSSAAVCMGVSFTKHIAMCSFIQSHQSKNTKGRNMFIS